MYTRVFFTVSCSHLPLQRLEALVEGGRDGASDAQVRLIACSPRPPRRGEHLMQVTEARRVAQRSRALLAQLGFHILLSSIYVSVSIEVAQTRGRPQKFYLVAQGGAARGEELGERHCAYIFRELELRCQEGPP